MLKKHMTGCLVATALVAAPALAQTSTAPAPSTTAPGASSTSSPMTSGSSTMSSSASAGQFMAMPEMDQVRASKVIGVGIFGSDNQRIGDVNEVMFDRQGNVDAIVIGVGGFLGIGEKNVAVPFKSVEWMWEPASTAGARTGTTTGTGSTVTAPAGSTVTAPAGSTITAPAGTTVTAPAGTTVTAPAGTTVTAPTGVTVPSTAGAPAANPPGGTMPGTMASGSTYREAPDRGMVKMTKAELENAPRFSYDMNRPAASATGTPPRQ